MVYPRLAGDRDSASAAPPQLFVGDSEIITDSAPALANITQWQVCVLGATGVTPLTDAMVTTNAADVVGKIVVAHVAVASGKQCPYYSAAKLNHVLLGWPSSLDTYAKRKAFVQGTMIQIGHTNPPTDVSPNNP